MTGQWSESVLQLFDDIADAVHAQLVEVTDWGETGLRPGQYLADVAVDDVAVRRLTEAGLDVLSEESGASGAGGRGIVALDPLDGSTNASKGVPWYATSLCLVDDIGPAVALVVNQATGQRFSAIRGEGAFQGSQRLRASGFEGPAGAFVAISGVPDGDYEWDQFRALGASALDLCLVAAGTFDAFIDMSHHAHGVWDYLAAALICQEAGAVVVDAFDRPLTVLDHDARRTPIAAATPELLDAIVRVRRSSGS